MKYQRSWFNRELIFNGMVHLFISFNFLSMFFEWLFQQYFLLDIFLFQIICFQMDQFDIILEGKKFILIWFKFVMNKFSIFYFNFKGKLLFKKMRAGSTLYHTTGVLWIGTARYFGQFWMFPFSPLCTDQPKSKNMERAICFKIFIKGHFNI